MVWGQKVKKAFPHLKFNPKAESCHRLRGEALFFTKCCKALRNLLGSSDLSWSRKELYRELVVGITSDPLEKCLGWSLDEIRSQWNWAPGSGFLNNSEFSLTWQLARNMFPLNGWALKVGLADITDCNCCGSGLEETALHAFYYCEWVCQFCSYIGEWTACIDPKQLVLLNVGYVDPPWKGEKWVVFLVILAVVRVVIWETRKKALYDGANFSLCNLILFFRHQLRVKIRFDRKHLGHTTFHRRWVHAASLVIWKGATLESSFPLFPAHGCGGLGLSGPHPG